MLGAFMGRSLKCKQVLHCRHEKIRGEEMSRSEASFPTGAIIRRPLTTWRRSAVSGGEEIEKETVTTDDVEKYLEAIVSRYSN